LLLSYWQKIVRVPTQTGDSFSAVACFLNPQPSAHLTKNSPQFILRKTRSP
jgi:hypothetical protein